MHEPILELLEAVARGDVAADVAAARLRASTDLGFAVVDDDREARTGLPEVVFGEGKTPEHIAGIFEHFYQRGQPALATRVSAQKAASVQALLRDVTYEATPRLLWRAAAGVAPFAPRVEARVAVICAGTSDLPMAEECARCAEWFGAPVDRITDVGVAGVHRLVARLDVIRRARVCVVVAGMEGALPSVVAGLVRTPVIGLPTSVGYGANLGGVAALLTMINSCAPGLSVVNIDNGFGAAQVAWRIVART